LLFFALACQKPPEPVALFSGIAMTIPYRISIGESLKEEQRAQVEELIALTFQEVDAHYNRFNPESELSKFNRWPKDTPFTASQELLSLLQITDHLVKITDGLFDPTIEPLFRLYRSHFEKGSFPSPEEVAAHRPSIGWDKIALSGTSLKKLADGVELDLGGVAKGYAVDLLADRLQLLFPHVLVDWGGEIKAHGHHPAGRPWQIFISCLGNPNPEEAITFLELSEEAIATSGDYLQVWRIQTATGEKTVSHIVNPKTLQPLEVSERSIASVSVLAKTCADADALATAGMLLSNAEEAASWAKAIPAASFWFLTRQKQEPCAK
jgi:thiamine biosynthesis lipoprotein